MVSVRPRPADHPRLVPDGGEVASMDIEPPEYVYRITRAGNGSIGKLHYRENCPHIKAANGEAVRERWASFPENHRERCVTCWPDLTPETRERSPQATARAGMERVTLRIPKAQIDKLERIVELGHFPNRSEAIRSGVRNVIKEHDRGEARWRPVKR